MKRRLAIKEADAEGHRKLADVQLEAQRVRRENRLAEIQDRDKQDRQTKKK